MDQELVGEWHLDGYGYLSAGDLYEDSPDEEGIGSWLLAAAGVGWPDVEPRAGLMLVIEPDGRFLERVVGGSLPMLWYDSDGVQVEGPEASEGEIRSIAGRAGMSLHPESDFPGNPEGEGFHGSLRIDDGDTMIGDVVEVVDGSLLRAISVVTDGMYFDRVVARYGRAPST